jgi:hypothetical protein
MQACELVELAAIVAVNARVLIRQPAEFPAHGVESYWTAAKCRLDRWSRAIKRHGRKIEDVPPAERAREWRGVRPVVEEIFLAEVLARVWTGLCTARDRMRGVCEIEPVARSVLVGQSEARNRALHLLVQGQGVSLEEAVELNRLRRRTERWNDLLLGCFAGHRDLRELAFESDRAEEFAQDFQQGANRSDHGAACQLAMVSLRCAFQAGPYRPSPNADLNARIAEAIIACLPADVFDSTGLVKSLWMMRIEAKTNDTEGMLAELLAEESPAVAVRGTESYRADGPHSGQKPRF